MSLLKRIPQCVHFRKDSIVCSFWRGFPGKKIGQMVPIRTTRNVGSEASWRDAGGPDFQKSLISLGRCQGNLRIWNHVGPRGSTAMACRGATFKKTMKSLGRGQGISWFWSTWGLVAYLAVACRDTKPLHSLWGGHENLQLRAHVACRGKPWRKIKKKTLSPGNTITLCVACKNDSIARSL